MFGGFSVCTNPLMVCKSLWPKVVISIVIMWKEGRLWVERWQEVCKSGLKCALAQLAYTFHVVPCLHAFPC